MVVSLEENLSNRSGKSEIQLRVCGFHLSDLESANFHLFSRATTNFQVLARSICQFSSPSPVSVAKVLPIWPRFCLFHQPDTKIPPKNSEVFIFSILNYGEVSDFPKTKYLTMRRKKISMVKRPFSRAQCSC